MKVLIWVVFGVLMALWTGFAAMSAGLVGWLLASLDGGQVTGAAQAIGQWPIPAWLGVWVDPVMVSDLQATWLSAVEWLGQVMPSAGSLTGWVVPLIWVVWSVGSACLLLLAGVGHWVVGKTTAR